MATEPGVELAHVAAEAAIVRQRVRVNSDMPRSTRLALTFIKGPRTTLEFVRCDAAVFQEVLRLGRDFLESDGNTERNDECFHPMFMRVSELTHNPL
jgi:hypothetical protein